MDTNDFLDVVGSYIRAHGGNAVVAGPITVEQRPGDSAMTFHLVVQFTGKAPKKAAADV